MEDITEKLDYDLIDMLQVSRAILEGKEPEEPEPSPPIIPVAPDELGSKYYQIPYREDMHLAAGGGGAVSGDL